MMMVLWNLRHWLIRRLVGTATVVMNADISSKWVTVGKGAFVIENSHFTGVGIRVITAEGEERMTNQPDAIESSEAFSKRIRAWSMTVQDIDAVKRRDAAIEARARADERARVIERDIESLSARLHDIYQVEAHRRGDVRHADASTDVPDDTKEWDRVLARWIVANWSPRCDARDGMPSALATERGEGEG